MDIQVRVKRNIKYGDRLVLAGEILSLSKEALEELKLSSDVLLPLAEEQKLEQELALAPKPMTSQERHFLLKEQLMREDDLIRERDAILLERQAEEQSKIAKAGAVRLRKKVGPDVAVK